MPEVQQASGDKRKQKRRSRLRKSRGTPDEDSDAAEQPSVGPSSGLWPRSTRSTAAASRRRLSRDGSGGQESGAGHGDAAGNEDWEDSEGAQSPDASPSRPQRGGAYSTRQRGAKPATAAGEAFRQRRQSAKPPPDKTAVAAASRQSAQPADGAILPAVRSGSDSEWESEPERSPPIQDFIDNSEPESGGVEEGGYADMRYNCTLCDAACCVCLPSDAAETFPADKLRGALTCTTVVSWRSGIHTCQLVAI